MDATEQELKDQAAQVALAGLDERDLQDVSH